MGSDLYMRTVLSLVLVIGLVVLCAWALRRFGSAARLVPRGQRRLGIVEVAALDVRHRLVLVRRDGIEHLLLVGPSQSLVIEAGINAQAPNFATHLSGDPS
jgi:flagellar protein FliO/FliZ